MTRRGLTLAVGLVLVGCGSESSDTSDGVQASSLHDVWVFSAPPPSDARAAELRGVPAVSGACLVIGTSIVVWRSTDVDQLARVVDLAKARTNNDVGVGGDLLRDWASQSSPGAPPMLVPEMIAKRCEVSDETAIWEAATAPVFY